MESDELKFAIVSETALPELFDPLPGRFVDKGEHGGRQTRIVGEEYKKVLVDELHNLLTEEQIKKAFGCLNLYTDVEGVWRDYSTKLKDGLSMFGQKLAEAYGDNP